MTAVPKPTKTKKSNKTAGPQLTEDDLIEIGERLAEAYEYKTTITITTFFRKKYETFTGIIKGVNPETKMISFDVGELDPIKINANIIVDVK
ncbi:hypothetical protein GCM10011391_27800 [Pullulanibacillus camelliae]|uniref:YolD-like family protein n=1 Tax=Pullulanibacillus camelliae TaxID=1707096 RepID=A0A8J3DX16_9BACL|nr:YolD-like family protein [Pullulanibacillus camelliae]GGE47437.1 hypothetical protein GCM10011391_27800 [Pullulanibacillus camelliae]